MRDAPESDYAWARLFAALVLAGIGGVGIETEERLLAVAHAGTAEHVERIVRAWRRVERRAELRETARHNGQVSDVAFVMVVAAG